MKASIGIATFVTALLAVLAISLPIPVALGAVFASAPASAPASRTASAPATQAAADLPVGTLMPVAEIVKDGVTPWGFGNEGAAYFNAFAFSWASAPADSGVVNLRAVVCRLELGGGHKRWSAALDSQMPDDQTVTIVRLDVTGKGRFHNAPVLPLKPKGFTSYSIGPVAVNLEVDGRTVPAMVCGFYNRSAPASQPAADGGQPAPAVAPSRYLSLSIGTAVSGTCRFGQRVYAVKLTDTNGNLVMGEPVRLLGYSHGRIHVLGNGGDSVVVLSKEDGSVISRALLGHPVLVDGVWYDVKVGPGGGTMEAAARSEPTGTVVIDADKWSAMLVQGKTAYCISGGGEAVNVSAGEYDIVCYQEAGRDYSLLIPSNSESKPETRRIKVEAGQTLALQIGPPLKGILKCTVFTPLPGQRFLDISLACRDVGDRETSLQLSEQGELLKVTIKDETGKELTSGLASRGFINAPIRFSWEVPDDVKGTLTVEVNTEKLPVKVDCPPVKVEVK